VEVPKIGTWGLCLLSFIDARSIYKAPSVKQASEHSEPEQAAKAPNANICCLSSLAAGAQ